MLVLDTNVVSELIRPRPYGAVLAWLDSQLSGTLFVTAVTEAEIRTGIAVLPAGKRQRGLASAADRLFDVLFSERVLAFDSDAAGTYAAIAAARRAQGRPIAHYDCQIAAIARSRGAAVATRNTADFEGSGIDLVNPWTGAS